MDKPPIGKRGFLNVHIYFKLQRSLFQETLTLVCGRNAQKKVSERLGAFYSP